MLSNFKLIYETYGTLNADKSNVIVICHALTGSHTTLLEPTQAMRKLAGGTG